VEVSRARRVSRIYLCPGLGRDIQRPHLARESSSLHILAAEDEYGWCEVGKGREGDRGALASVASSVALTVRGGGTSPLVVSVQLIKWARELSMTVVMYRTNGWDGARGG
jgi:hypothetical protein